MIYLTTFEYNEGSRLGRRRRRVIKIVKKTLPKVYTCPQCGMVSIRVFFKEDNLARIVCGNCGLKHDYSLETKRQPIDIYNEFVDEFMSGRLTLK
jgi:transcription elongation factor Elf1